MNIQAGAAPPRPRLDPFPHNERSLPTAMVFTAPIPPSHAHPHR
jgi:hypothetical protein